MPTAQDLIQASNPAVFTLESLTGQGDRTALLRAANLVAAKGSYRYAEVGCHLGGTLVAPLQDARCSYVAAVDNYPAATADERSVSFGGGLSAAVMVDNVRRVVPSGSLAKLQTFECDASAIEANAISGIDLCFIDGEHTNRACFSDFLAMMRFCARDCVVLFHDANLVSDALHNVETYLRYSGRPHRTLVVPNVMYVALIGSYAETGAQAFPDAFDKEAWLTMAKEDLWGQIARTSISIGRIPRDELLDMIGKAA